MKIKQFVVPSLLVSTIISCIVSACRKDSIQTNANKDLQSLEQRISSSQTFQTLMQNGYLLFRLEIETARPNSFFYSKSPRSHPVYKQILSLKENETEKMKELYLTQFTGGAKMVDLIQQIKTLRKDLREEFPEMLPLAQSERGQILKSSAGRVTAKMKANSSFKKDKIVTGTMSASSDDWASASSDDCQTEYEAAIAWCEYWTIWGEFDSYMDSLNDALNGGDYDEEYHEECIEEVATAWTACSDGAAQAYNECNGDTEDLE